MDVAVLLGASACGGGGYKTQTVSVTEKDTNFFGLAQHSGPPTVALGPHGPETLVAGDVLSFSNDLLDSSKKKVASRSRRSRRDAPTRRAGVRFD